MKIEQWKIFFWKCEDESTRSIRWSNSHGLAVDGTNIIQLYTGLKKHSPTRWSARTKLKIASSARSLLGKRDLRRLTEDDQPLWCGSVGRVRTWRCTLPTPSTRTADNPGDRAPGTAPPAAPRSRRTGCTHSTSFRTNTTTICLNLGLSMFNDTRNVMWTSRYIYI